MKYLGDNVFALWIDGEILLKTIDGGETTNTIRLSKRVLVELKKYNVATRKELNLIRKVKKK